MRESRRRLRLLPDTTMLTLLLSLSFVSYSGAQMERWDAAID
jgi:hypothetical protein